MRIWVDFVSDKQAFKQIVIFIPNCRSLCLHHLPFLNWFGAIQSLSLLSNSYLFSHLPYLHLECLGLQINCEAAIVGQMNQQMVLTATFAIVTVVEVKPITLVQISCITYQRSIREYTHSEKTHLLSIISWMHLLLLSSLFGLSSCVPALSYTLHMRLPSLDTLTREEICCGLSNWDGVRQ